MELLADGLLIATTMTAGLYCMVLSRRLRRLTDSGDGIGPQIDALDRALNETKAALTETRDTVSDMRRSAKASLEELTRETSRGEETAGVLLRSIEDAKAALQRLYEAGERIRAYEDRHDDRHGAVSVMAGAKHDGASGDDGAAAAGSETGTAETDEALGPTVILHESGPVTADLSPGWDAVEVDAPEESVPAEEALPENATPENAATENATGETAAAETAPGGRTDAKPARGRSVLQAERVLL